MSADGKALNLVRLGRAVYPVMTVNTVILVASGALVEREFFIGLDTMGVLFKAALTCFILSGAAAFGHYLTAYWVTQGKKGPASPRDYFWSKLFAVTSLITTCVGIPLLLLVLSIELGFWNVSG